MNPWSDESMTVIIWKSYMWTELIMNQHNDQLPAGLLAQLVENCTGIAEVIDSNTAQAWI